MSEPSLLNGDLQISERLESEGGGNLIVDGNITCEGTITANFPQATASTPGAVQIGAGLGISAGVVSWKGLYRYKGGQTVSEGLGSYICVDNKTLEINDSAPDICLTVNLKSGGGIKADASGDGIEIDSDTVKTILGLKAAAYKEIASNSGTSTDADKIPALGSGGVLNYAVIPTDYVRTAALTSTLQAYVTSSALGTTLAGYLTTASFNTTIANYVTQTALGTALTTYVTSAELSETLAYYVTGTTLNNTLAGYATVFAVQTYVAGQLEGYSVITHQHTVQPVYAVPVSGIINLEKNKTQYQKTITGNTIIGFDATGLNLGSDDSATFELLLKMGTTVYPVLFGSQIAWLNEDEPIFNNANKSYLLAFRTYNGGQSWVGAYQGQF